MAGKAHISMTKKAAAALLTMREVDEHGHLVPLIPWEHAKLMTADQIVSLFEFDHDPIRESDGGPTEPWNLNPKLIKKHRFKTAKKDRPEMAKSTRLSAAQEAFRRTMLAKVGQDEAPPAPAKMRSRPMPGTKASGVRKKMNGRVEKRGADRE